MNVGVVGLGQMGHPMALTLRQKGFSVTGYDPAAARRELLPGAVASLDDLRVVDVALLSLPGPAEVDSVVRQLVPLLRRGAVIIDTSTVAPETTQALQTHAATGGIAYVDAPVSGGTSGAAAGTLLVMAGGLDADISKVMPVLQALARKVVRCGSPGSGNTVKLVNNLLCAANLVHVGEALRLAAASGVSTTRLLEALNAGSGGSRITEVNVPRWIDGGSFDSGFTMGLMDKDVRLAAGLPGATDIARDMADRWREASARLGGHSDFNRIVQVGE